jgi:hypothetical protein
VLSLKLRKSGSVCNLKLATIVTWRFRQGNKFILHNVTTWYAYLPHKFHAFYRSWRFTAGCRRVWFLSFLKSSLPYQLNASTITWSLIPLH